MPLHLFTLMAMLLSPPSFAFDQEEADQHVARAENHMRGKTFEADAVMKVAHDGSDREMEFHLWTEGLDKTVIKVSKPAKDRDTGNLRLTLELWQYLPNIERLVKIPASMMLQSWMGSDFTHDDLVKTSSLVRDYTHEIADKIRTGGYDTVKIVCTPKPNAPVVWGKVILWVRGKDSVPIRQDFFSESGELVKQLDGKNFKTFGKHTIATTLIMKNLKSKDHSTTIQYSNVTFDRAIDAGKFSQEFLRKPL